MKFLRQISLSVFLSLTIFSVFACSQENAPSVKSNSSLLILNKAEATLVIVDGETLESKLKIRYFWTTPQQADGAFAQKLVGQSTDYHEFSKNKKLHPFRVNKETPKQAIGEFFSIKAKIPTGDFPHEVAVSKDGKTAYVANYGAQQPNNSLSIIDLVKKKEIKRIDLGGLQRPHGIVEADGMIYFTSETSRSVARFNTATEKVDWIMGTGQTATHMLVITPDKKKIFTANIGSDTVTSINLDAPPSPAGITQIQVGKQPEAIDVSPDGKEIWVGQNGDGKISVIDAATNKIKETFSVGKVPIRLKFTPDGRRVLVSDAQAGEFVVVDAKTRKEIKRVSVGGVPVGIQIEPNGKRAFVALTQADAVKVFDLEKMEFTGEIKPGKNPDGMMWAEY